MKKSKKRSINKVLTSTMALSLVSVPFVSTQAGAEAADNQALSQSVQKASIVNVLAEKPEVNYNTAVPQESASTLNLRIMETTDIHTNLLNFDYYKNAASEKVGLARTATLIEEAREEKPNSVLVDNGDLIQGTPLGTYVAKIDPLEDGELHPSIAAMNTMGYDMATLGNHEFNYGLDFLDEAYDDANFDFVNANVYTDDQDDNPENDVNEFTPYRIVDKEVTDEQGNPQTIKIGYIGFAPPQINDWDKANLDGKVVTKDIIESANKFIPQMKQEGADVIIAMAHSGFNGNEENTEDTVYSLSKVEGIDAITFSHTHKVFPAKTEAALDILFKDASGKVLPGVDNAKGTINGVAAVQAGYGGGSLGLIDLTLEKQGDSWTVTGSQSSTREVSTSVALDQEVVAAVTEAHNKTIEYVNQPIGTTTDDIYSYFALVQDDPSVQVVTNAQKWFVEKYINLNKPEYKDLPILSVGAPFKAGRNGAEEYTEIKKGNLTIRSAGDLYLYDNTLKAVKVKGSVVKEWIEMTAGKFNTIDPAKTETQELLNPSFPVYNFDVIDGVNYQIDVTKPAKYDKDGKVINANSSRVVNLTYNGQPVDPDQDFIVVTNNYRAGGGGNFPGVKGSELVVDSADENRQILMDYITEEETITPTADNNWSIAPIDADVKVTFTTSPKAEAYLKEDGNISYTGEKNDQGFGIFNIDLKGTPAEQPNDHVKVQLLGLNDLHGQLDTTTKVDGIASGRIDFTAAAMKEREADNQNTLLVHAGDMIGGSPLVSALFQDEPTVEIMEAMGFDVGTLGNHEFDEGIDELKRMINGGQHPNGTEDYDGMNFPVVAANVYDDSTDELITEPYAVKEVGGQKIGFIGVVTQETPDMIVRKGNENLKITDEVEAINKYTKELQEQGVEAIVVLAHNPTFQEQKADLYDASTIAENVDDAVDIIFAAHNHVKVNKVVDNKLIVQAYSYGTAFSDVDIEIDPATGDIVGKAAEIVQVKQSDYTPDADVAAILKKYADKVEPIKAVVVGENATELAKGYPSVNSEYADNGLGNLIADGMIASMDADFALMNGGGVRANLPAGDVTFGSLFAIQPFGNVLNKVKLSGADLETILNKQITEKGLDFHIAGFKYTYSWDSAAKKGKVVDILNEDGTPIDKNKEYTVVMNNYMYGNLSYGIAELATDLEVGQIDLDATVDFVKTLEKPFTYGVEGRIQKVAAPTPPSNPGTPSAPELPYATVEKQTVNGQVYAVAKLDEQKIQSYLASDKNAKSIAITLPAAVGQEKVKAEISAEILEMLKNQHKKFTIEVNADKADYKLSVDDIKVEDIAKQLGAKAEDVKLSISVNEAADTAGVISKNALKPVSQLVEFNVSANAGDKVQEISRLPKYNERVITLNKQVDPKHATVVKLNADGTFSAVPTKFKGEEAIFKSLTNGIYTVVENSVSFKDITKIWNKDDIETLASKYIVQGYEDGTFKPNTSTTRLQLALLLTRSLGLFPEADYDGRFKDIGKSSKYAEEIMAAVEAGIIKGKQDGKFDPNETVNREQAAAMIKRAMDYMSYDASKADKSKSLDSLKDQKKISSFAKEDIEFLLQAGVMSGKLDGKFDPKGNTTRAQIVKMIQNALTFSDMM
ncbi:bifunctional 2',3'-cyclic-nucleotide 2'-phosphodiesterase/3'-nucleotidase [Bacillus sp. AG4(2022)]|uniref:bifunctional 2',3'-cyclic-nucleotide 2'-phosphodiesterase/3'-nucleotidase n=1 Tax=Bacillus sp. AG4(2022) TaxID=2962594 RepID=UPI002880D281|nr:bifunctional 2',3'-cyclic-nucleotide 2'-phosphodiesterase/3'-nucleotidase [Bacillus sp. AG4(2022)]MDT0161564.1 bifunctional 2',3'-cyclic-nucleotide 2'-phosphodiesterase/3'-nucleotidase [Bacillus sp. AG4(2022)]